MRWIKEVEMVDSVDDLKTSQSIRGHRFPNFEMPDARIASSQKKIVQNSNFTKRVNVAEQKAQLEDRFLRGGQIACIIYEYFRITITHGTILEYSCLFRITLHGDEIQDFDTRWDEVLLSRV